MRRAHTPLNRYLSGCNTRRDLALYVLQNSERCSQLTKILEQEYAFVEASNWREILRHLDQGQSTYCFFPKRPSPELYDLILQYQLRAGRIEIFDPESDTLKQISFNPRKTKLLLLSDQQSLRDSEKKFPLIRRIGLAPFYEYEREASASSSGRDYR